MVALYSLFPATIQTELANTEQWAQAQGKIQIGTPGYVEKRNVRNGVYFYHRFYDANGNSIESYIGGPEGAPEGELAHKNALDRIAFSTEVVNKVKMFRILKYSIIEDKAGAALAALHNHRLFDAGLTLVGSHAYGAIANNLGLETRKYLTDDIDTVRSTPLNLAAGSQMSLLEILQTSGLPFLKTKTSLKPGGNAEAYKLPGKEKLMVDLLVNGTDIGSPVFISELDAYAQSVPYLDYMVKGRLPAIVMSKHYIVPVYTPAPARFAVHKLFSAMSRVNEPAKSNKDILQAATIICALEDLYSGDIAAAMSEFPEDGKKLMLLGAEKALPTVISHSEQIGEAFLEAVNQFR